MSESKEMYLATIAQLNEVGVAGPVSLTQLASKLEVQTVSINQMVHKLEEQGLLTYTPYSGVELTEDGKGAAMQVLRKRRLWEVFLVEHLHLPVGDAEETACQLEHVLPNPFVERFAEFLDYPQFSPQGKLIPKSLDQEIILTNLPLSTLITGEQGEIAVMTADNVTQSFLSKQGFAPKTKITILAIASNGERLLSNESGNTIHLSVDISETIWIKH